jgi:hypothetical protein
MTEHFAIGVTPGTYRRRWLFLICLLGAFVTRNRGCVFVGGLVVGSKGRLGASRRAVTDSSKKQHADTGRKEPASLVTI